MENINVPIMGFKRYSLNLVTHEITNGRNKIMSQRYDGRGTLITNLVNNNGKQKTVNVYDLVENTIASLEITEGSTLILAEVLLTYYSIINSEIREIGLMDVSAMVHEHVPGLSKLEIGRILSKIH